MRSHLHPLSLCQNEAKELVSQTFAINSFTEHNFCVVKMGKHNAAFATIQPTSSEDSNIICWKTMNNTNKIVNWNKENRKK